MLREKKKKIGMVFIHFENDKLIRSHDYVNLFLKRSSFLNTPFS